MNPNVFNNVHRYNFEVLLLEYFPFYTITPPLFQSVLFAPLHLSDCISHWAVLMQSINQLLHDYVLLCTFINCNIMDVFTLLHNNNNNTVIFYSKMGHSAHFWYWILMLILILHCGITAFTQVKYLSTSSNTVQYV